tara:strand:- start:376 stop:1188 length:813 start_codon:yes stop_codon:yes gene_type:complete
MNCHYVTRSLTKPWEGKERKLTYYDFESDSILEGTSKTLFAEKDLIEEKYEDALSKLIERPLGIFKQQILEKKQNEVDNWNVFRALFLYFFVQTARFSKFLADDSEKLENTLEELLSMEEAALNTIVSKYMEKYSVATIGVPDDHILLFPETGFFTFPLMDSGCVTGFTFSYAVPLFPSLALALVPKTLEKSYEDQIKRQLMSYSVGINEDNCNRVVIPASLSEVNEEAVIIEGIKYYRKISIETAQNVHKLRSLVVEMYEKVGLKVGAI